MYASSRKSSPAPPYSPGRCGAQRPASRTLSCTWARSLRDWSRSSSVRFAPATGSAQSMFSLGRISRFTILAVSARISLTRSGTVGMGCTFIWSTPPTVETSRPRGQGLMTFGAVPPAGDLVVHLGSAGERDVVDPGADANLGVRDQARDVVAEPPVRAGGRHQRVSEQAVGIPLAHDGSGDGQEPGPPRGPDTVELRAPRRPGIALHPVLVEDRTPAEVLDPLA